MALFALNAGFGWWRMSAPPESSIPVALVESDDAVGKYHRSDKQAVLKAVAAYTREIAKLGAPVSLIVMPENIALIDPAWRKEVEGKLADAAANAHATIVAGFNTEVDGAQRNVALAFVPPTRKPVTYLKRRLVPGLETDVFTPGPGAMVLVSGIGA